MSLWPQLADIVFAWNTIRMEAVVERLRKSGVRIENDWLRQTGPAYFAHIKFRGTMKFGIERFAQALIDGHAVSAHQLCAVLSG